MGENIQEIESMIKEERERFLEHVSLMVDYWSKMCPADKTVDERLEGLAFSILVAIDGEAADLPGYFLIPNEEDSEEVIDISNGALHEYFMQVRAKKR